MAGVGLLERLGLRRTPAVDLAVRRTGTASVALGGGDVAQVQHLPVGVAEAFGINVDAARVTRREAMSIPAVRRGRQIIAGTIGTLPLQTLRAPLGADGTPTPAAAVEPVRRSLLEQPDPNTTRQHTITWTVDDLVFYGLAWWRVLARDPQGYPTSAERLAPWRVRVEWTERRVYVDGQPAPDRDLIRFDGPDEGILATGARALRTAILLEDAVRRFAVMDVPLGLLKDTRESGPELAQDEVDGILTRWRDARTKYHTGWLSKGLAYEAVQFNAQQLQLTEARQLQAVEVARLLNLEAAEVNAPSESGMTYNNRVEVRRARIDAIAPYMTAIEQRLSLGDVTPRGQRVVFDTTDYIRGDARQQVDTAAAAVSGQLMDVDEARQRYLGLPPRQTTTPVPEETP